MNDFSQHKTTVIALILVCCNFIVKGIFLSSNSLGGDEPFSVYHAQMDSILSIARLLSEGNNPPLYEIFLCFWVKLFGISEFSVRFPSLIFSSITVLFIFKLGAKFLNQRIAIYASVFFIFSNYQILFAHEARVYSMLGMLSVLSMYFFMAIIQYYKQEGDLINVRQIQGRWIGLVVVNTFIIYAHYFGFFILIVQFLFFVFYKKLIAKHWKPMLIYLVLIGILYLPNIYVLINRFIASSSNGTWLETPDGLDAMYNMLRQFSNAPVVAVGAILVFLAAAFKFVMRRKIDQGNSFKSLVVFWFLFIFFFMFGVSYWVPMFLDRYLMPAAIAFALILGLSVDYVVQNHRFRYLIPGLMILLFVVTSKPDITNKRNVREVVEKIKEIKDSNTLVLICPNHFMLNFAYYYDRDIFGKFHMTDIYSNINESLNSRNIFSVTNIDEVDYKKWDRIIYLDAAADFSFPNNNIRQALDKNYEMVNEHYFYEIFYVYEYFSNED